MKSLPNINVKLDSFKGSIYSQVTGVSVTDIDVTIEFVYLNPRNNTEGEVVARVTLPRGTAESLSTMISDTIKKHDESTKK